MTQHEILLKAMMDFLSKKGAYSYTIVAYFGFSELTLRYDDVLITYAFNFDTETQLVDHKEIKRELTEFGKLIEEREGGE